MAVLWSLALQNPNDLNHFAETFLASFITPIMGYMLEERLHLDPSKTQSYTTILLSSYGFVGLVSAPAIAYFAERAGSQKKPLLIALVGCLGGTLMVALASSCMARPLDYGQGIREANTCG